MNAKEKILQEAENIVAESGAVHLTLDAVAARAGISKGGLLYHFPNKEELIRGMVENYIKREIQAREDLARQMSGRKNTRLKAHIAAWRESDERKMRLASSLVAAVSYNPELLKPAREKFLEGLRNIRSESSNPLDAIVLFLAVDGLWLLEILGISPFSREEKAEIFTHIEKMVDQQ